MRTKRKVVLNLMESNSVNNARLAEFFAEKFKERGLGNVPTDR